MNECNLKMLNDIYQNTSMGIKSIDKLEDLVDDAKFLNLIRSQKREYIKFNDSARDQIREYGKEPDEIRLVTKLSSEIGMTAETFIDSSVQKLAQMMIDGNSMGIDGIKKELVSAHNLDPSIKRFCDGVMAFQRDCITSLQKYAI